MSKERKRLFLKKPSRKVIERRDSSGCGDCVVRIKESERRGVGRRGMERF